MRIIKETHIKFMSQRRASFILSLFLIFAGIGSLVMKRGPKLGIDFRGGTLIAVQFTQSNNFTFLAWYICNMRMSNKR